MLSFLRVIDDPSASGASTAFMTALGLVVALFALYLCRRLFRPAEAANSIGDAR